MAKAQFGQTLLPSVHVHVALKLDNKAGTTNIQCCTCAVWNNDVTMSWADRVSRTSRLYTSCVGFSGSALLLQEVKFLCLTSSCSGRVAMPKWGMSFCFRFLLTLSNKYTCDVKNIGPHTCDAAFAQWLTVTILHYTLIHVQYHKAYF